jgi:hypothetical protein
MARNHGRGWLAPLSTAATLLTQRWCVLCRLPHAVDRPGLAPLMVARGRLPLSWRLARRERRA